MATEWLDYLFTWEEVGFCRTVVTSGDAHKMLSTFRKEATGPRLADGTLSVIAESVDLTNRNRFEWHGYLAGHPHGREIVGKGVTKFELRFLAPIDHNQQQRRLDFIVHRRGEEHPHVRLHPHGKPIKRGGAKEKEALPIYGNLADWAGAVLPLESWGGGLGDGANSPVADGARGEGAHGDGIAALAPVVTRTVAVRAVPQQDVIGRRNARLYIDTLNRDYRRRFYDLTHEDWFPWHRYLRSSPQHEVDPPRICAASPQLGLCPAAGLGAYFRREVGADG